MIALTRLNGQPVLVNPDLIETVGSDPDTVINLVDGQQLAVAESPDELQHRILTYRAAIISAVEDMSGPGPRRGRLISLPRRVPDE